MNDGNTWLIWIGPIELNDLVPTHQTDNRCVLPAGFHATIEARLQDRPRAVASADLAFKLELDTGRSIIIGAFAAVKHTSNMPCQHAIKIVLLRI